MRIKKARPYLFIFFICIAGYFISLHFVSQKIIQKEITYSSIKASEVYMVWGLSDGKMPDINLLPANSTIESVMVYTKMVNDSNKFITNLRLRAGTNIYYWMLQRKDKVGNSTDIWDSGGDDREFYEINFTYDGFYKPGYFIFLAGFLPLILHFYKNRNNRLAVQVVGRFKLNDYITQFDSIRAIAVLLVIFHHWLLEKSLINFLPNGPLGVNIFFVLSGFLITGILFKAKKQVVEGVSKASVFKNFYIRRTLRIFPIYYLLLFILFILNDPAIQKDGIYYFTYTSNILFYNEQFFSAHLSHLWSLAVEEQFYVFWPFLIILTGKKFLPYFIALFMLIGISANFILVEKGWWVTLFTPACFDAFAMGAFLAYLVAYRQDIIEKVQPKYPFILAIVVILLFVDAFGYGFLPRRTVHAIFAVCIIYYCLFRNNNIIANHLLNNKWLIKIGKVSYGVYLYHLFIPELWTMAINYFSKQNFDLLFNKAMPTALQPTWLFVQHFTIVILLSIVSWNVIEKPINRLKSRFTNKPIIIKTGSLA